MRQPSQSRRSPVGRGWRAPVDRGPGAAGGDRRAHVGHRGHQLARQPTPWTNDAGIIPRSMSTCGPSSPRRSCTRASQHLIDNTIPFVFMGVIIALRGAARLALVTLIVIVVGGLGTWLIAPAGTETVGASGVVFGYATYLFARGLFDRSALRDLHRRHRRRRMGRGAALERRAPRRDLLAGPRVRRHRRRHRRMAAGWASDHVRSAPTPRWRGRAPGCGGRSTPSPVHDPIDRALARVASGH